MSLRRGLSLSIMGALATSACANPPAPAVDENPSTTASAIGAQCGADAVIDAPQRASSPVLVARRPGLLDLVYTGSTASLRHRTFDATKGGGAWSTEDDWGGSWSGKPGAAAWGYFYSTLNSGTPIDRLDVMTVAPDQTLQHLSWVPAGTTWDPLGSGILRPSPTTTKSAPALTSRGLETVDAFYTGTDGTLQHRVDHRVTRTEWDWSAPEALGGALAGAPAAVSWGAQRIDVFGRNAADNQLWHRKYDNGWSAPELLGGNLASDPTVASWGAGRLDVFWRDSDGALKHNAFDSAVLTAGMPESKGWLGEEAMGGDAIEGNPSAASW